MAKKSSWLEEVVVFLMVRVLYFLGAFLLVLFAPGYRGSDLILSPWYLLFAGAMGLLAALVGPGLYAAETNRGRGMLGRIREASRRRR